MKIESFHVSSKNRDHVITMVSLNMIFCEANTD